MPFTAFAQEPSIAKTSETTEKPVASEGTDKGQQDEKNRQAVQDASKLVDELFIDRTHEKIKGNLVEAVINTAEAQVNLIVEGEEKTSLQLLITKARSQVADQLAAKEKTVEAVGEEKNIEKPTKSVEQHATPVKKEMVKSEEQKTKPTTKLTKSTVNKPIKKGTIDATPVLDATKVNMKFEAFYLPGDEPNEVIKQENATYHPKIGDETLLRFNWELPNSTHGYMEGQQFTFKLPENFTISQYIEGQTNDLGNFTVDTSGNVTLTLTEKVEGTAITDGYIQINAKFKKVSNNELQQKIDFGQYGGLQILLFTPKLLEAEPSISKLGDFYRDPSTGNTNAATINPDGINWTITLNKEMANITNAVVSDVLPAGQELLGDITATISAPPGLDGTPSTTTTSTVDFLDFPIDLGNVDSKIVLKFKTKTMDPQLSYENTADLKGKYDGVDITKLSNKVVLTPVNPVPILKSGKLNNTSINWEVKANMNGAIKMGETFVLTDTLSADLSEYQKFDANSVEVYEYGTLDNKGLPTATGEKLNSGVNVVVDDNTKTMTVTIANSTGKAYIIKYNTIKSKAMTTSGNITNTAMLNDAKSSKAESTVRLNESTYIEKSNGTKVSNGVVKWTITANKQQDTIKSGSKFIDTLESRLDWPVDIATKMIVKAGNTPLILNTDYTVDIDGKIATVELKKDIKAVIAIDYETNYTIDSSQSQDYKNTATFNGQVDSISKVQTVNSKFTQIDIEKNNGSKTGSYNLATKQFDWEVIVNNNMQNWTNAKFTDTLPKGHELVTASFKVDGVMQNDVSSTAGKIEYTIGSLNKQIVITYSTKDSDQLLEKNNNNKVVISADHNITNTFEKNIVIETNNGLQEKGKGNAFVTKTPGSNIGRTVPWSMTINASLSTLNHAVLTDTTDGQQIFDPTSFKLTKSNVIVSANGVNINWATAESLAVGDHTDYSLALTYDAAGKPRGFKLTFKNVIDSEYKLEYKSKFSGVLGKSTENTAELTFDGSDNITLTNTGGISKKVVMTTSSGGATAVSKANLKIVKKDDSGQLLKGVEFTLYNFDGSSPVTKVNPTNPLQPLIVKGLTDANGEVFFNDLDVDEYIIKETGTLPGYTADTINTDISLTSSKIVTITNTKIPMCLPTIMVGENVNHMTTLEVLKKGTDGKYTVVKTPDGKIVTAKIESNGKVTLPKLDAGEYKFELTAQDKLNNKFSGTTVFKVNEKGVSTCDVLNLTFDIVECATFDITVVNQDSSPLNQSFIENSKFKLVDTTDAAKVFENITINENGQLIDATGDLLKHHLKKGKYKIIQTVTPIGYKAIVETISVTDTADICLAEITLTAVPTACLNYAIVATDIVGAAMTSSTAGYSKYVNEAQFNLTSSKGAVLTGITIDSNTGKLLKADHTEVSVADLDTTATYTLEQSNTVIGYTKLSPTDVIPSLADCFATVIAANTEIDTNGCTAFDITIKDTNDQILNASSSDYDDYVVGSEFKLSSSNSTVEPITGVKMNIDGKLVKSDGSKVGAEDLKSGEYTLIQTKTPPGFVPAQTIIIPNGADCSAYAVINLELTTNPTTPGISCPGLTINYNGPANSQAEFKLVKVETDATTGAKTETDVTTDVKVVTDATTNKQKLEMKDSAGEVITALEAGDYKLVQTKAHAGYQTTSATFTVTEGVCQAELTVTNSPTPPPVCDRDTVITITDTEGTKIVPNDKAVVTVDGKTTNFTVEDDKVVIPKTEISKMQDTVVTITLEDGRTTTTTLSKDRVECTVDVQVPVLKLCTENPTITITTPDGKEVSTDLVEKVIVNGEETPVVTENGKVVIPKDSVNSKEDTTVIIILKDGTEGTVTIPKFTEECTFTIVVDQACDKLTVNVTNNGKAVKSGTVEILDADGKVVATAKIDSKGQAIFEAKYANSKYSAKVTVGNKNQTVKVTVDDKCAMTVNLVKACEKATVTVKVDGSAKENITVKVVDSKDKTVQKVTTDEHGVAKIDPKYVDDKHKVIVTIFEETKSYEFHDCAIHINVKPKVDVKGDNENGKTPNSKTDEDPKTPTAVNGDTETSKVPNQSVTVKGDTEETKSYNVSVPTEASPGQTYNVYDENGNLVGKNAIVGKDGKVNVKNLPAGKYKLVSTDGEKTVEFTVDKDGKLPQTGTQDFMLYTFYGLLILAAGVWLLARNRKKNA